MVHPCRVDNPGTTLHACGTENSKTTLCGLDVEPQGINVVAGYKWVCRQCFPQEQGGGEADSIGGR